MKALKHLFLGLLILILLLELNSISTQKQETQRNQIISGYNQNIDGAPNLLGKLDRLKQMFSSLIPKAEAITCMGSLGFGGRIQQIKACNNGLVISVGPPCGGTFFFSFSAKAYMYYFLKDNAWVLGKHNRTSGSCILGYCPYCIRRHYEASVIMYGVSQQ